MKAVFVFLFGIVTVPCFNQVAIDSGLVALYPFCGDVLDRSGNNNDGTIYGGVTFVNDRLDAPNSACHFNGVDGFIQVANSNSLNNLTDSMTLSCWFYTKSYDFQWDYWVSLFSKSDQASTSRQYSIIYDKEGNIWFDTLIVANQILEFNTWYQISMTYDSMTVKCYLDGSLIGTEFLTNGIEPNNLPLDIGRDVPIATEFHHGMIDDIRIYNRVLTNEEIGIISSTNFDCNASQTVELKKNIEVKLYPNPTMGEITLESDNLPPSFRVKIYDLLGRLIREMNIIDSFNDKAININGIEPGIYTVVIETSVGAVVEKIIKM